MTLRQLRQVASGLGVGQYSRKPKNELTEEISAMQTGDPPEASEGSAVSASLAELEADFSPAPRPGAQTKVVFLPRDPQWAYVFWEIADGDRRQALSSGASQLCLRVADVTGLSGGATHTHTLQEVPVDSHATEWYLPVPMSDRDYRVEMGYRKVGGGWISLGFSASARVPALHPSEQILDQFVPFSLESPTSSSTTPFSAPVETAYSDLHERLYKKATLPSSTGSSSKAGPRFGRGSEAFHERGDLYGPSPRHGLSDSGIGVWASGRNESVAGGVASRQRSFWLVADAELIVYGSTDPSAKLSIGNEDVPLSPEGTFRIQVPFRDGQQLYPIEAIAADGEQKRSITLQFGRSTPEDNSNPSSQAIAEWF
ncbi:MULTISPECIES: DUF4912 domain-containing protein [Synechococcaceae]|uniref:DUF4912 domain-containing protein n=1 Tax=Synechococcaceae TaxID=1890426 RepID=UPI000B1DAA89|nr:MULTISPECIES: DUF4912 domain-containing protein [Synechococcaceae]MCT0245962.1 DUF4912 domain-containing protein [Synechococcus sp. CS-601]MCT4367666.1 DUF4912 domain-containing protein [Candidatus Regnicoccus frigidus MAG-AL2]TWB89834.1 hypothetical protein FB106_11144 [Synechococcus sp. Ace-Pa]